MVVIEDLHWLDPASDAVVRGVVDGLGEARVLIVLDYRPHYESDWLRAAGARLVALEPLPAADIGALLDDLIGTDASLAPLRAQILARAGGNRGARARRTAARRHRAARAGDRGQDLVGDARVVQPAAARQRPSRMRRARAGPRAGDARELAQSAGALIAELSGQLALAAAGESGDRVRAEGALARAATLIDLSGAEAFRPRLHFTAALTRRAAGDERGFAEEAARGRALCVALGMDELADLSARELAGGEGGSESAARLGSRGTTGRLRLRHHRGGE